MKIFLYVLSLSFSFCSYAADAPYAVYTISPALLKNANVVKRMEEIRFEIKTTTQTTYHYKYALTILNENGDKHAQFFEWYDKLSEIVSIEGNLYDAYGKNIKQLKTKDVKDLSAVGDISLMDDNRKKIHNFYHKVYPYTIEYEVKKTFNHTFHFPYWVTQEDEFISVEKTSYTLTCPADYQIRYRALNYKGEPVQSTEKNKKSHTWQAANIPAVIKEFASPRWHELTTIVSVAPTEFEIEKFKGNMSTWKDFGKFLYSLNQDRNVLPGNIIQKVHQLTDGLKDDKEKINVLYNFLQQNTRYISIQLGIGGWQPFNAAYVAEKGYGDCKALSNYMYSLLKEVKIKSLYALIKAGKGDHYIMEDLPSNQFNHAILCVPLKNDTVWLECTSQTDPAGYMGNFTGNRKALVIDENGGTLVNTPRYGLAENLQLRSVKGKLEKDGSLNVKVDTRYRSIQQDDLHQLINGLSKEKIKETLEEKLELATYDINDFKYVERKEAYPQIEESLDIYVSNYGTITGKRIFVIPNLLNRSHAKLDQDEERKYPLCIDYAYKDVDSVEIEIPAGYKTESMPQSISLKTKFGSYKSQVSLVENKLFYIREREQFAGTFLPGDYNQLVKYYSDIYKADRNRVVLVNAPIP